MVRYICLVFCATTLLLHASDPQEKKVVKEKKIVKPKTKKVAKIDKQIEDLAKTCKQETFGTTQPASFDPTLRKELKELSQHDPAKFAKLVTYAEQQRDKQKNDKQVRFAPPKKDEQKN